MNGTATVGTSLKFARADHVHPTDTSRAALASPAFSGSPTAPTAASTTNTTQIATTAFVQGLTKVKAWVNFNGTSAGTWPGGTSTVSRTAGSTTATVTTTTAHGLNTGGFVYALTGVAAGSYSVTVTNTTTFTITTVATTALAAVSITFAVNTINGSYNVSSVSDQGVGNFIINFATALTDANACVVATAITPGSTYGVATADVNANVAQVFTFANAGVTVSTLFDHTKVYVAVFR